MTWLLLLLAILFEVAGTTCMKYSHSFTRVLPSILMFLFYGLSLGTLVLVLKKLDISVAYAVWSGLGTALIATLGIFLFQEPTTALKVVSILLIILGVVGLNLSGGVH